MDAIGRTVLKSPKDSKSKASRASAASGCAVSSFVIAEESKGNRHRVAVTTPSFLFSTEGPRLRCSKKGKVSHDCQNGILCCGSLSSMSIEDEDDNWPWSSMEPGHRRVLEQMECDLGCDCDAGACSVEKEEVESDCSKDSSNSLGLVSQEGVLQPDCKCRNSSCRAGCCFRAQ